MSKEKAKTVFDEKAAAWDENPGRVKLAHDVAEAIIKAVGPMKTMDALDIGCGTGLVTLRLQPHVKTITGADSSKGMIGVLESKVKTQGLANVRTQFADFERGGGITGTYDLIVSSMTLHHVKDTLSLFGQWYMLLRPGGRVCFADLDAEDGSFHPDKTGVFHHGFDREHLKKLLKEAGFSEIRDTTAAAMSRDVEGIGTKQFPVFLLCANK